MVLSSGSALLAYPSHNQNELKKYALLLEKEILDQVSFFFITDTCGAALHN